MRIPPPFLDCSLYVYKTVAAANEGQETGGSGCIIGVPSIHPRWVHLYAANKHLIDAGYRVLRLNTNAGKTKAIETDAASWQTIYESGDVAICPLALDEQFRWQAIYTDEFLNRELMDEFKICPGEDVFLIGRLVTLAGRQRNTPVVRFGNIAMLPDPDEPIRTPNSLLRIEFRMTFNAICRSHVFTPESPRNRCQP